LYHLRRPPATVNEQKSWKSDFIIRIAEVWMTEVIKFQYQEGTLIYLVCWNIYVQEETTQNVHNHRAKLSSPTQTKQILQGKWPKHR
jgi:hypothetical protein